MHEVGTRLEEREGAECVHLELSVLGMGMGVVVARWGGGCARVGVGQEIKARSGSLSLGGGGVCTRRWIRDKGSGSLSLGGRDGQETRGVVVSLEGGGGCAQGGQEQGEW